MSKKFKASNGLTVRPHTLASRKPWHDAEKDDVWLFENDRTQLALAWMAGDGTWDLLTPRGDGIKKAADPIVALRDAGFDFDDATGRKLS